MDERIGEWAVFIPSDSWMEKEEKWEDSVGEEKKGYLPWASTLSRDMMFPMYQHYKEKVWGNIGERLEQVELRMSCVSCYLGVSQWKLKLKEIVEDGDEERLCLWLCVNELKNGRCEAEYGRQQGHDHKRAISQFNKWPHLLLLYAFYVSFISPIR